MFKKIFLAVLVISLYTASFAQRGRSCPKVYLAPTIGINNPVGMIGLDIDVPISPRFSLSTGGGLSSWGFKGKLEGRYFFRECNRGWAFGIGGTYNTGGKNINTVISTNAGSETATFDFDPVPAVFFSGYHFFNLGQRHRFYLQLGWSQRFEDNLYTVTSPHILTSEGRTVMDLITPGGVIFAFGFSFGIGG